MMYLVGMNKVIRVLLSYWTVLLV